MRRAPHENVATVLVDPHVLENLEPTLMAQDMHVWPVRTAPIVADGPRRAFQIRRSLIERHQGAWDCAAQWVPVWIGFGSSWRAGDEPLPWSAHAALWRVLDDHADQVRFHKRLGGVRRLPVPEGPRLLDF